MKPHASAVLAPTVLFLAGPLVAPTIEAPSFAVENGSVLRKSYERTLELTLEELTIVVDGQEFPHGPQVSMEQNDDLKVEFVDTYEDVGGGRPLVLQRTYVTLESMSSSETSSEQGDESREAPETSDLEGLEVVFKWNEDDEEYEVEFVDSGNADLLEGLEEDTDLRGFLPDGDVEEGDSWDVDAEMMAHMLSPGGDLSFVPEDGEEPDSDMNEQFRDNMDGEMSATFGGVRDVDGTRVAVIEIAGDMVTEASEDDDERGSSMTAEMSMEVEGEILWDLERGHFLSLEVNGTVGVQVLTEFSMAGQDGEHTMEQTMSFAGTLQVTAEATSED